MPHTPEDDDKLDQILAILKLSTKYQIGYLRFHSLRLLHADFVPLTLEELVDQKREQATPEAALEIIPVVRQCNALWLLPSLYYTATALSKGVLHDLDDLAKADLGPMEERLILRGRTQLMRANNEQLCEPLRTPCNQGEPHCDRARLVMFSQWCDTNPLGRIPQWRKDYLCKSCSASVRPEVESRQRQIWEQFPSLFDLPPWEELRAQQSIDLGYLPLRS